MEWDAKNSVTELQRVVDAFDRPAAEELCDALIASTRSEGLCPEKDAKNVLGILRRKRYFDLLQRVAEALIESGQDAPVVQRQYAQALIDQGQLTVAARFLRQLVEDTRGHAGEHAEARGLLGRVYKQQYVNARGGPAQHRVTLLRNAVEAYYRVYLLDQEKNYWHGINAVACVCRARRDNVPIDGAPDPEVLAREILARFQAVGADKLDVWQLATAAEACLALAEYDDALLWIGRYVTCKEAGKPAADAFEIASTLRQLKEVWGLTMDGDPGTSLLPLLEAHLLRRSGGALQALSTDLRKTVDNANVNGLQAILGNVGFHAVEWLRTGMERSAAVGRITSEGFSKGTGFLVRLSDIGGGSDEPVLVTNSHVISEKKDSGSLAPSQARFTLERDPSKQYQVKRVLWNSRSDDLDTTVAQLACPPEVALTTYPPGCAPFPWATALPPLDREPRVYIIGYPGGGPLSFSLEDNMLLDHDARLAHYRAPTIRGSSGSPVFDAEWNLAAIHHAGGEAWPRLNGSGTHPANEGILMSAIRDKFASGFRT